MIKKIIVFSVLSTSLGVFSQSGINTESPNLLSQLEISSNNKGVLIPRVALVDITNSMPISENAATVPNSLLVYNTTTTAALNPGYYFWLNLRWNKLVTTSEINILSANDGVVYTNNNFSLGGNLANNVNINTNSKSLMIQGNTENAFAVDGATFSVDGANHNVGIGTTKPKGKLNVVGDVFIEGTQTLANARALVIDNTGKVGTAASIPAKVLFVQSEIETNYSGAQVTSINAGDPIVVSWSSSEIITNNIMDFSTVDNSFVVKEDGFYEVSGFLNYNPNSTFPTYFPEARNYDREHTIAGVNGTVQVQIKGTTNWIDLASARVLFAGAAVQGTASTIVIPPAVRNLKKGDKVRMIFKRPAATFGLSHGSSGSPSITVPSGILFSKGMKIIGL